MNERREAYNTDMAYSRTTGNGPSPSRRERRFGLSGAAVLLAVATSGSVLYAGAVGAFTAPLAVAAACGACAIAAISTRHAHQLAELLPPLADDADGKVVVHAPRAADLAGRTAGRSDAA